MGGKSALLADIGEEEQDEEPSALLADIGDDSAAMPPAAVDQVQKTAAVMRPDEAQQILDAAPKDKAETARQLLSDLLAAKDRDPNAIFKAMSAADTEANGGLNPIERFSEAALGSYAPEGLGRLASAGFEALQGGATSGLAAYRDSDKADILGRLMDAAPAAAAGAGIGLGGSAVGQTAGAILEPLGRGIQHLGARARNAIVGNAQAAEEALKKYGADAIPNELGGLLEKYSPSSLFKPKSAQRYLKDIEGQRVAEGQQNRFLKQQAAEEGVDEAMPQIVGNIQDRTLDAAVNAGGLSDEAVQKQAALERIMNRMGDDVPATYADAVAQKAGLQRAGNTKQLGGIGDSASQQAAGEVGGIYRDELQRGVAENASPYTSFALEDSDKVYSQLSTLEDLLRKRAAAEQGAGGIGTTLASTAIGAGVGAATGAATGSDPITGALYGAGGMAAANLGLTGGATQTAIRQALGSAGTDIGANFARGVGRGTEAFGQALSGGKAASNVGQMVSELAGGSRGHESTSTVERTLEQSPQQFGQFRQQLEEAKQRGELREEVSRLMDDDQDFRAIMRQLTGGDR